MTPEDGRSRPGQERPLQRVDTSLSIAEVTTKAKEIHCRVCSNATVIRALVERPDLAEVRTETLHAVRRVQDSVAMRTARLLEYVELAS